MFQIHIGIITNVKHYVLRTDSVITEALLGQGEALDCFNQKAQDAVSSREALVNAEMKQRIDIINAISDPIKKSEAYKKLYGDCCNTPQCVCGCREIKP